MPPHQTPGADRFSHGPQASLFSLNHPHSSHPPHTHPINAMPTHPPHISSLDRFGQPAIVGTTRPATAMKAVFGATMARAVVAQEKEEELGESGNVEGGGALVSSPTDSESSMPSSAGALDSNNSSTSSNSGTGVRGCWRRWTFNETWFFHDLPVETVSYSRFSDDSNNKSFLILRGFLALYWAFITVLAGTLTAKNVKVAPALGFNNEYAGTYFLYVTYWTCLLQAAYLLLAFVAAAKFPAHKPLYRACWCLRNIVAPASCMVAGLYWSLIFPANMTTDFSDASVHGSNAAIMLLDLAVARYPLYLKHFWQPFLYVFLYVLFNGLYVAGGGTDSHGNHHIYEVLNYKPLGTSLVLLALVLFVALPLIFAGQLGWVRLFVRLSPGTLPDHQPLTPTSGNSSLQQQPDGSTPSSSPASGSPTPLSSREKKVQSLQMVDLVIREEEDVA